MSALLSPEHSDAIFRAVDAGFRRWRDRRVRVTPVINLPSGVPRDRPLVLVANHTSWWDGFLLRDVHCALRHGAPMHTVMTADELGRHPYLRWLGAVPLAPGTAGVRAMLRELQRRTALRRDATVVYFPQGTIWPAWRRPLGFRRGIEAVLRAVGPCYVLPVGLHVEPLNHTAPTVFRIAGGVLRAPEGRVTASLLEGLVSAGLNTLQGILAEYGEATAATISHALERAWSR